MLSEVILTSEKKIPVNGGDITHVIKSKSQGFIDFGEAYFSNIDYRFIKAWKRHKLMTLNLFVPVGKVKFVIFDDRLHDRGEYREFVLSEEDGYRLTIPPMVWFGFMGLKEKTSMLLNIANICHDPYEVDREDIDKFPYNWREL